MTCEHGADALTDVSVLTFPDEPRTRQIETVVLARVGIVIGDRDAKPLGAASGRLAVR